MSISYVIVAVWLLRQDGVDLSHKLCCDVKPNPGWLGCSLLSFDAIEDHLEARSQLCGEVMMVSTGNM